MSRFETFVNRIDGQKSNYIFFLFLIYGILVAIHYTGHMSPVVFQESLAKLNAFAVIGLMGINALLSLGTFLTHGSDQEAHAKLPFRVFMSPLIVLNIAIIWENFFILAVASGLDRDGFLWLLADILLNFILFLSVMIAAKGHFFLKKIITEDGKLDLVPIEQYTFWNITDHILLRIVTFSYPILVYGLYKKDILSFDAFSFSVGMLGTLLVLELSIRDLWGVLVAMLRKKELPFIDTAMMLALLLIGTIQMTLGLSLAALAMAVSNGITMVNPSTTLVCKKMRDIFPLPLNPELELHLEYENLIINESL